MVLEHSDLDDILTFTSVLYICIHIFILLISIISFQLGDLSYCFLFCLFLFLESERAWAGEGEGQRGRKRERESQCWAWSPMCRAWSHDPEIMTWAEIKSWSLNWMSQIGALILFVCFERFYLFIWERESAQLGGWVEGEADFPLSRELNAGLNPRTLRSWPELKP